MKKRIIAMALCLAMCFTSTTAYAVEGENMEQQIGIETEEIQTNNAEEAEDELINEEENSENELIDIEEVDETESQTESEEIEEDETEDIVEEKELELFYSAHVQNIGWQEKKANGSLVGTTGKSLRMEAFKIWFSDGELNDQIEYRAHVQNQGWQNWVQGGQVSGTEGESLRVEAVQIRLKGELAEKYNIYYNTHVSNFGTLSWASNGKNAGSQGFSERMEAMKISLISKEETNVPSTSGRSFVKTYDKTALKYSGHIQNVGDVKNVSNGQSLGTSGRGLRIEGISVSLDDAADDVLKGGVTYRLHVQNIGWQGWKKDGEYAGTRGKSLRVEAMQLKLTGEAAARYNIYYRAHVQNVGWLGWAKNGAMAGSQGLSLRMEAVQIVLVPKTQNQSGYTNSGEAFYETWVNPNKPMIALTFDDGPGKDTGRILDVLDRYNAGATFFMLGNSAKQYPNTVKRIAKSRSEIGNHSLSHPQLTKLGAAGVKNQMNSTSNIIASASGGARPTVMRPPYGAVNNTVRNNVGAPVIMWSIDTLDWKTRNTQNTINVVLSQARDGDIVLMHDIHKQSVDAAVQLIPKLIARGYQVVTVSELAKARGIKMSNGQSYSQFRKK